MLSKLTNENVAPQIFESESVGYKKNRLLKNKCELNRKLMNSVMIKPANIISFPKQTAAPTKRIVLLGMLFVSFLIVSNLTAFKIAEIHLTKSFSVNFPAALMFFPLTYFFDDILTEVYGFKMSRLIIWGGLACSALITVCTWIAVQLPASPVWDANTNHGAELIN